MNVTVIRCIVAVGLSIACARGAAGEPPDRSRDTAAAAPAAVVAARPHVRAADKKVVTLLDEAVRRSPTVASLVERIEQLQGLVYVLSGHCALARYGVALRGGMSHAVTNTGELRIIRVTVQADAGDQSIATLGHELWHAIEVLEDPTAVDAESVGRMYERIGFKVTTGVYETTGAARVSNRVLRELKQDR